MSSTGPFSGSPGYGRGLRYVAFRLGYLDEPVGEHCAALPAQCRDRQLGRSLGHIEGRSYSA